MITRDELTRIAARKGFKNLAIIEKDYALTWALKAIYSNEKLYRYLVFKGGTCLSKVYSETYRLSEDLDFSAYREGRLTLEDLQRELKTSFEKANSEGAPTLQLKDDEILSNPGFVRFIARYTGPLGQPAKIKLEITTAEHVIFEAENLALKEAAYPDIPPFKIHCYHFSELFTEKVRAIMQRGKSRDYYDVWQMLTNPGLRKKLPTMIFEVRRNLLEKCERNGIDYEPEKIFSSASVEGARAHWKDTLGYLVKELPNFDKVIEELGEELFEEAELARFSKNFDTGHIRNIVRQEGTGPLILRAIELVGQKLESKKVSEVEIALDVIPIVNEKLKKNQGWKIAMTRIWKRSMEILSEDKDTRISGRAKELLDILSWQN